MHGNEFPFTFGDMLLAILAMWLLDFLCFIAAVLSLLVDARLSINTEDYDVLNVCTIGGEAAVLLLLAISLTTRDAYCEVGFCCRGPISTPCLWEVGTVC